MSTGLDFTPKMPNAINFIAPATLAITNAANAAYQNQNFAFLFLFAFRYLRLVVHIISYLFLYKADPVPEKPSYRRSDCTVIVPTVDPLNEDFNECLHTILMNSPAAVAIVTVGTQNKRICESVVNEFQLCYPNVKLSVLTTAIASKRRQVCAAIPHIETKICVLADDHVFWPSLNFLPTAIAPFEDPQVGCVGTNKKVRRFPTGFGLRSFLNFLGATYLERHNFELAATNAVDGGVFVVSGRTSLIRTIIVQDPAFMEGLTNEMFFFGKFGPLNADDDNFITRWLVANGWKIKVQFCKDATVETTLGTYPKFFSQCLRWVRTTWRSNSASLFTDGTVWSSQPWCVYAVYVSSFFNFALFYDAALMYSLYYHTNFGGNSATLQVMAAWIFATKMVKLVPHFWNYPADLVMIPGYILFAYYHSLLKLYALFTFYVTAWGGRNLAAFTNEDDIDSETEQHCGTVDQPLFVDGPKHVSFVDQSPVIIDRSDSDDFDSSSTSSSSSWTHYSPPLPKSRNAIETPWGLVRRNNLSFQPANVLESQIPLRSLKKVKKESSSSSSGSSSNSVKSPPRPKAQAKPRPVSPPRAWVRGVDCGRQHDGHCMLDQNGKCEIWNVRDVQWNGR